MILGRARDVFLADPKAPIAAVADRAGVGISALYRRYTSKDDLLRTLCHDGLRSFIAEAERAAEEPDGWAALVRFLGGVVEADVHSLTVHLAGTFTPTPEMSADAVRPAPSPATSSARAHEDGRLRPDVVVADVTLILEACAAIRVPDRDRTVELRRRHLALLLDGMRRGGRRHAARPATGRGRAELALGAIPTARTAGRDRIIVGGSA